MPDNVHKFRRIKWADPKWFKMIDGFKSKPRGSRYFSGLVGFNAPETGSRARCETERQKGEAAQRRLREQRRSS
ncbi:hypothetical protein JQ609_11530 [Bradyrhizobium sp. AUGA SZCCT0169]|jgi:hypothetical protein|uniref:hypothetical protein n=1 Tax=unclassified Bradyrhizobium TaxID=2631580 RepID=UPI001BA9F034|nr:MULTISPECIES: hypothetical protein [unclassified Bradyrhizobium]MBR1191347.1 hypothetical protein [Bradyrhizobium sp. AUGA SZCCT0160]MBR1247565.1 hypothetical protein [Bradyrhizobium sp. AUGA SZCCT0169]